MFLFNIDSIQTHGNINSFIDTIINEIIIINNDYNIWYSFN